MPSPASTPSSTAGRSTKMNKKTKTIVLKLTSSLLNRFPGVATPGDDQEAKSKASSSSPTSSPTPVGPSAASVDNASEPRSSPPVAEAAATAESPKKKPGTPSKTGTKRAAGSDAGPKPRARPGPKKKARLDDGTVDSNGRSTGPTTTGTHKLGPKANQGAINAGLRALDRTGKPCRRWERKAFQLKSFTGTAWQVRSWRAPPRPKPADVTMTDADTAAATPADDKNANNKDNIASSAVASERSNAGETATPSFPGNAESSPAPVAAAA
ncbi:hypothetical protein DIZ76_014683 [Coccidioides immitis]|nr:hypothetical protein DIZ76_014683 [Coccidioides immitis]